MNVRETNIDQIKERLGKMSTDFNKLDYLESAVKTGGFSFEIKRFLYGELAKIYEEKKMYEKAAKALVNKVSSAVMKKEKIEDSIAAAELHAKLGKIEEAENMFAKASHEATAPEKAGILLARKNIYLVTAKNLEAKGKKASSIAFYEKLLKMKLSESEKDEIKKILIERYKALGMFREARMLEGD